VLIFLSTNLLPCHVVPSFLCQQHFSTYHFSFAFSGLTKYDKNATIRKYNIMKDKAFLNLSILFFIIFFAGIAIITLDKPTSQLLRAANVEPSPLKSFAVVFPQTGKVADIQNPDSGTKIKAVITIRDVQGNALPNRTVKLSSNLAGTLINPSDTQTTSDIGQATYFIKIAGNYFSFYSSKRNI